MSFEDDYVSNDRRGQHSMIYSSTNFKQPIAMCLPQFEGANFNANPKFPKNGYEFLLFQLQLGFCIKLRMYTYTLRASDCNIRYAYKRRVGKTPAPSLYS